MHKHIHKHMHKRSEGMHNISRIDAVDHGSQGESNQCSNDAVGTLLLIANFQAFTSTTTADLVSTTIR